VLFGGSFPAAFRTSHGVPLYFEATAFITTVVLLGQILERLGTARVGDHDLVAQNQQESTGSAAGFGCS